MGSSLPTFERQQHSGASGAAKTVDTARPAANQRSAWSLHLSLPQVIVMWSVLAGSLIMSFLFGMYTGREQGLNSALEEYRGQAVRIPVAEPLASREDSQEVLAALDEMSSNSGAGVVGLPQQPEVRAANAEPEFDFSPESKLTLSEAPLPQAVETKPTAAVSELKPKSVKPKSVKPKAAAKPPAEKQIPANAAVNKASSKMAPLSSPKAGWYVQVAAARSQAQASKVYFRAVKVGLNCVLEQAKVRGQNYYRVIVGPYSTREAAVAAKPAIKKKGISRAEPFLKRVI